MCKLYESRIVFQRVNGPLLLTNSLVSWKELNQNIDPPFNTDIAIRKFTEFKILRYPPHNPDLVSSDYLLFESLKKYLQGRCFLDDEKARGYFFNARIPFVFK